MIKKPLVSICSLTYNHENYVAQAIEGFLMQKTTFPIEIIIHDDASTDNTANIIREYENRYPDIIKPIYQNENQWSKGIRPSPTYVWPSAKGKYIALCEGDDYWTDPYKLQKQVDFLERNHKFVMIYTNFVSVNEKGKKIRKGILRRKQITSSGIIINDLVKRNFIMTVTTMIRTDVALKAGTELNKNSCFWSMDYAFFFEIAGMGLVFYLDDVTSAYRILTHSASHRHNLTKRLEFLQNTSKIKKCYNTKYSLGRSEDSFERELLSATLKECSKFKDYKLFFSLFSKGLRSDFRNLFIINNYLFLVLLFVPNWRYPK